MSPCDLAYSAPEGIAGCETDLEILERRLTPQATAASERNKSAELETRLEDLHRAGERERRRAWILEMVSSRAPLAQTLSAVAALAKDCYDATGAALWVAADDVLSLQATVNLPGNLEAEVSSLPFDMDDVSAQRCDWFEDRIRAAAAQRGDHVEFVPLRDREGRVVGLLVVFGSGDDTGATRAGVLMQLAHLASLAIESGKLHERLAFHSQHDVLTGLPNRLLFQERLRQAVAAAERTHERAAVLWLDLDHYKQVNDTLGHTAGDELLREVASRLRACVHHTDTVARFGGDEFTLVISNVTSDAVVEIVSARILKAICRPVSLNGHEVRISASIGMSMYPDHGLDADVLMRNADLGMYHAKRSGRNQYQMFLPEFGNSLKRRLEIEEHLGRALEFNEFHLEYQPLIGLRDEIAGMEALLRWDSPKLGRIGPAEFIPVAEEMGLIVRIGEWVARAACRDGAHWIKSGAEVARIAINVSGLQLVDRDFGAMIVLALDDFGFPAQKLEIEVTETVLIGNLERAVDQIARLRAMGIYFSIDDFGAGYSSLNQLRTLPVDNLKLDRSFINDIERLEGNSLVRGIIELAHSLQLKVVAEGVETEAQLVALRSMGCDRNQGFHLHMPMRADAMMRLLGCDPLNADELVALVS